MLIQVVNSHEISMEIRLLLPLAQDSIALAC